MKEALAALARPIAAHYPGFKRAGAFLDADTSWIGLIRPFSRCSVSDLLHVIDDLKVGENVLLQEGALLHNPLCSRSHDHLRTRVDLEGIRRDSFAIRLVVWPPPAHPKAFALFPEISSRVFKRQPHLFQSAATRKMREFPNPMPDALCTYRPGDGEWSWSQGDLVLFLDFVSIFLAKHAVWVRTGGDRSGVWLGPAASHAPADLIKELDPEGECRCGNGKRYRDCHLSEDRARAETSA